MNQLFIFFLVKDNEPISHRLSAMPDKKKTPVLRGPAGFPPFDFSKAGRVTKG